ncbi:MAG: polyphenol oxidase family protein [Spirochaetia bacterium]
MIRKHRPKGLIRYPGLIEAARGVVRIEKKDPDEPELILTLRGRGDMKREENRGCIGEIGMPLPQMLRQVHSRRVVWACKEGGIEEGGKEAGREGDWKKTDAEGEIRSSGRPETEADGLLSADRGVSLGVTVADCMPIYLFTSDCRRGKDDQKNWVFGVLHSGWQGTGIVKDALDLMRRRRGIEAETVSAVLGPSIRSCCYKVDGERGDLFSSLWGEKTVRFDKKKREASLDLVEANLGILRGEGVEDIRVVESCTCCDTRFGSFRREGPETFTHMLAMIGFLK